MRRPKNPFAQLARLFPRFTKDVHTKLVLVEVPLPCLPHQTLESFLAGHVCSQDVSLAFRDEATVRRTLQPIIVRRTMAHESDELVEMLTEILYRRSLMVMDVQHARDPVMENSF